MEALNKQITNENTDKSFFAHNLSFIDIVFRYAILMIIVIIGGLLNSIPVMLLGLPFFWAAILGWCPVYKALGINRHTPENGMC